MGIRLFKIRLNNPSTVLWIEKDYVMFNNQPHTAVYFVPNYLGLYSVKVISTENSVQRLQNKKLNKTKGDCTKAVKIEIADS